MPTGSVMKRWLVSVAAALVLLVTLWWIAPDLYEIFRVPNYYICDPFWPFDCQPGF